MHFYSTTFDNKERTEEINQILGKPIGLLDSIKLGGKGSHRMLVEEVSDKLQIVINPITQVNYGSIELRPKGIIFHFVQGGLKSYAWLIPYYKLSIFFTESITIHADGEFAKLRKESATEKARKFILKVLKQKANYLSTFENPNF